MRTGFGYLLLQVLLSITSPPGWLTATAAADEEGALVCNGSPWSCSLTVDQHTFVGLWGAGASPPAQGDSDCPAVSVMPVQEALSYGLRYIAITMCQVDSAITACQEGKRGQVLNDLFEEVRSWLEEAGNRAEVVILSLGTESEAEAMDIDLPHLVDWVKIAFGDRALRSRDLNDGWPTLSSLITQNHRVVLLWSDPLFKRIRAEMNEIDLDYDLYIEASQFFTAASEQAASVQELKDEIADMCELQATPEIQWDGPLLRVDVPASATMLATECRADFSAEVSAALLTNGRLSASPLDRLQASCWAHERQLSLIALPAAALDARDALILAGLARSLNEKNFAYFVWVSGLLEVAPKPFLQAVRAFQATPEWWSPDGEANTTVARKLSATEKVTPGPTSNSSTRAAASSNRTSSSNGTSMAPATTIGTTTEVELEMVTADRVNVFLASRGGLRGEANRLQVDASALPSDDTGEESVSIPFKILATPGKSMEISNRDVFINLRSSVSKGQEGVLAVVAECGDPGKPVGGGRRELVSKDGYTEGAVVKFICDPLQVNGSEYRVCGQDALFTGVQPVCLARQSSEALTPQEIAFWKKIFLALVIFAWCLCSSWCCWHCFQWHRTWTIRAASKCVFETFAQPQHGLVSKQDVVATVEAMDADSQGLVDLEQFRRAFEVRASPLRSAYERISLAPDGRGVASRRAPRGASDYVSGGSR